MADSCKYTQGGGVQMLETAEKVRSEQNVFAASLFMP